MHTNASRTNNLIGARSVRVYQWVKFRRNYSHQQHSKGLQEQLTFSLFNHRGTEKTQINKKLCVSVLNRITINLFIRTFKVSENCVNSYISAILANVHGSTSHYSTDD